MSAPGHPTSISQVRSHGCHGARAPSVACPDSKKWWGGVGVGVKHKIKCVRGCEVGPALQSASSAAGLPAAGLPP